MTDITLSKALTAEDKYKLLKNLFKIENDLLKEEKMIIQLYKWTGNTFSSTEFYTDNGVVFKLLEYGLHLNLNSKYFSLALFSKNIMYDLSITTNNLLDKSYDGFLIFRRRLLG